MQRFDPDTTIDNSSKLALDTLRQMVAQRAEFPQRALPTERDLAADFGLSRRAIRRALSVLEAEGQIWRRQGKGTFVGPTPPSASLSFARLSGRTNFSEVMESPAAPGTCPGVSGSGTGQWRANGDSASVGRAHHAPARRRANRP